VKGTITWTTDHVEDGAAIKQSVTIDYDVPGNDQLVELRDVSFDVRYYFQGELEASVRVPGDSAAGGELVAAIMNINGVGLLAQLNTRAKTGFDIPASANLN
jgi:hypothetical protein